MTLPTPETTRSILATLLRKNVSVKTSPWLPSGRKVFIGVYTSADGTPDYLWLLDLPLAAALASALVMLPRGAAADAVAAQSLSAELVDNAREVANVCSSSFSANRVRLTSFLSPNTPLPPALSQTIEHPGKRLDLSVEVDGYAPGNLCILSASR